MGTRIAPFDGLPPTGGWWCEYQTFSIQLTTLAAPCSRNHSAARAPTDEPLAGSLSADPNEMPNGIMSPRKRTNPTSKTRRRLRFRRARVWSARTVEPSVTSVPGADGSVMGASG